MYSFYYLEPVFCSMSSSNSCFLICIQISQEGGQVVWYSIFFKNFTQLLVIHTIKGCRVVNKADVDVFLELSCFFDDPKAVGNLISGSLPFLNPVWTSGSSQFMYCWSLAWRISSIPLLECERVQLCSSWNILWHGLSLGLGKKTKQQQKKKQTFSSPVTTVAFSRFASILSVAFHSIIV